MCRSCSVMIGLAQAAHGPLHVNSGNSEKVAECVLGERHPDRLVVGQPDRAEPDVKFAEEMRELLFRRPRPMFTSHSLRNASSTSVAQRQAL